MKTIEIIAWITSRQVNKIYFEDVGYSVMTFIELISNEMQNSTFRIIKFENNKVTIIEN